MLNEDFALGFSLGVLVMAGAVILMFELFGV